jgi:tryptophanyl-tRNA synthetase
MKKRIFSGAQPTGSLHIGNYLGALKNWVALQNEYESFFCIVNLHAVTLPQNPKILRQKTLDLARIYLASGVDPKNSTVFIQSDVSEHAELAWILSCIARMGELERMTQFKDKGKGNSGARRSRAFHLSGFDGGGHFALSNRSRSGRTRPETASRITRDLAKDSTAISAKPFVVSRTVYSAGRRENSIAAGADEKNVEIRRKR